MDDIYALLIILTIVGIIIVGFILFCIYFIFKQIQFVLIAVNLYKKMVLRQDTMIKILLDIRDQTKSFNQKEFVKQIEKESNIEDSLSEDSVVGQNNEEDADDAEDEPLEFCYHCGTELKDKVKTCPNCGKKL